MALLALRSQSLWPIQVLVHNCFARQRKLIHFNGTCVFLFVRPAIAGCWCFLRRLTELSATLYLTRESRLQALPRHFSQVGGVYFKAGCLLAYGLLV